MIIAQISTMLFLSEPVAFRRVYGLESYSRTSEGIEPPPAVCQRHKSAAIPTAPRGRLLKSQLCIPKPDHLKMIFSKISTTQRDALIHKLVDNQQNQIRSNMHATDLSVSTDVHFHTPLSMRGQHGNLFCQNLCSPYAMYMASHPISDKNKLASAADGDRTWRI